MRGAIISLNKRIILKERNIRALEAINFRQWLLKERGFHEVDFISIKTKAKNVLEDVQHYKDARVTDLSSYPHMFLHNDTDNLMGGVVPEQMIKQIKELCHYKGNVYYLLTDPNLPLLNMAAVIYDRQVRGVKTVFKDEQRISQEEVGLFADLNWRVLWVGKDFDAYRNSEYQKIKPSLRCKIAKTMPINLYGFMFKHRQVELWELPLNKRRFDLTYYGNWRPRRQSKFKLYFNNDLRKRVIGFDDSKLLLHNTEYLPYAEPELLCSLVQEAVASIVIGDPAHNNNVTTARFYENILFDVCSFIDLEYDPERTLYKSDFLRDIMYVRDGHELQRKINLIKADEQLFKSIIEQQKKEIQ
jgi:hypothetical protein